MSSSKKHSTPTSGSHKEQKRTKSTSQATGSSSDIPPVREPVQLPAPKLISDDVASIINALEKSFGGQEDTSSYEYPIIIGSRAAVHWIPYFRLFADWDLIAAPYQALNMVKALSTHNSLTISFISQPLDKNIVRRKPMTPEIQEILDGFPSQLYKISSELEGTLKFEIEIASEYTSGNMVPSSAGQIFKVCYTGNDDDTVYLNFPTGCESGYQCIIAPIEVLETIKCSHIHWPAYFSKHISDIHLFRTIMAPSASPQANIGLCTDMDKPLTTPERTAKLKHVLLVRTVETESFRGTPGAHINLNVSNEDFLGRDNDLFVNKHITHDDVHNLVKYGDSNL